MIFASIELNNVNSTMIRRYAVNNLFISSIDHVLMFVAVSLLFARVACRNPKGSLMTRKRPVLDIHRNLGNPPNKMPTQEQTTRPSVCYLPTPDRSFSDRKQYR